MTSSTTISSSPDLFPVFVTPQRGQPVEIRGVHPAAALFPLIDGGELKLLSDDIRANGLREAIVLHEGLILDGRNRLRACDLAGVKPRFVEWDGRGSPLAFVLSRNLHRRHLDESQRAIVAARAKEMFKEEASERQRLHQFGSRKPDDSPGETQDPQKSRVSSVGPNLDRPERSNIRAAKLLNVSKSSVALGTRVLALGDEQVIEAVELAQVSVSDAAAVVELPKSRQREALELVRSGKARTLREAAKKRKPRTLPPAVRASNPSDPHVMRGKVRRAYRYFKADCEALFHFIDLAAEGCGGPNDFTRRAREGLATAERAMEECQQQHGRKAGDSGSRIAKRNPEAGRALPDSMPESS